MKPLTFISRASHSQATFAFAFTALALSSLVLSPIAAHAASQCNSTSWAKSNGRTCSNTGLDSKRATCNGGAYAVFCDDTKTQMRTCPSNIQCDTRSQAPTPGYGNFNWQQNTAPAFQYQNNTNHNTNRNNGRRSGNDYEVFRGKRFHCTEWDYKKERPCKRDTFNEDCWGNCS